MRDADVLYPPLAPPAACARCLRPLEPDKRHWGTCYLCGREHPPTLCRIAAATYGATGTRPWTFFTTTKFEQTTVDKLASFVNGIAAMISLTIDTEYPAFVDGGDEQVALVLVQRLRVELAHIDELIDQLQAGGCCDRRHPGIDGVHDFSHVRKLGRGCLGSGAKLGANHSNEGLSWARSLVRVQHRQRARAEDHVTSSH